jgi:hypothetical protein
LIEQGKWQLMAGQDDSYLYSQSQALLTETPSAELQALKSLSQLGQSKAMIRVKIIKHIPPVGKFLTGIFTGQRKVDIAWLHPFFPQIKFLGQAPH